MSLWRAARGFGVSETPIWPSGGASSFGIAQDYSGRFYYWTYSANASESSVVVYPSDTTNGSTLNTSTQFQIGHVIQTSTQPAVTRGGTAQDQHFIDWMYGLDAGGGAGSGVDFARMQVAAP